MSQRNIIRICAVVLALSGLTILFSTIYPILSYEWEASQKYPVLISPLVDTDTGSFKFSGKDYTKANNWFENTRKSDFETQEKRYFSLSIPKLKIDGATVTVGGEDLSDSLVQFPGTALPGEIGNSVIFGHSILPQYFDPNNYLAIFSTLPTLTKGDEVFANMDGATYKYIVREMFEVKPTDIQILEQSTSSSYITLVTCTPPGHPLKPRRLIVRAELVAS
jgi:sortase A